ncbi:error-prone DNA polymerase [Algihabitans albus]|uniref:error-prone DNA polymerase n=1 Tax=Algihabitans albus TaxID=2164067 RepID=UPI000E5CC892|nr:error-prone DNA polymerase [Algihabitans albus]
MRRVAHPAYAELVAATNFSFLRAGSHPEELVTAAKALGLAALGIADRNSLAGVVRAHTAAEEAELPLLVGSRLVPRDGPEVICYPKDRPAYGRLCKLLTLGKRRAAKGECDLSFAEIVAFLPDQVAILLSPDRPDAVFEAHLGALVRAAPGDVYLGASWRHRGDDARRLTRLAEIAARCAAPLVAVGEVLLHHPARKPLLDTLTCIREGVTIDTAGWRLEANAERHLKSAEDMARLFSAWPEALSRTLEIAGKCRFKLDELTYEYPIEKGQRGRTPQQELEHLTWEGAAERYPQGLPQKVRTAVTYELNLIAGLNYAAYFLTVYDLVRFARSQKILCQGRGSAANSAVCYCLGITSVDPAKIELLFERFVSAERGEPPDIDVDFEHERREEVIQYVYAKYGRDRAGLAATVICYRSRGAVREVGKALGLSEDTVTALAGSIWGWSSEGVEEAQVRELGLDPESPRLALVLELTRELIGFPRHLSQHVGGFVMTRGPLDEVVPIENAAMADRTVIEWDKDDLESLGLLKVDVLALGMLTCLRKGFALLQRHYGRMLDLAEVPQDDPAVYDMLSDADSLGVFQVESRAQMNMLPRLRPKIFYDLVIQVAIVRPGPIQGDMVHPYLRRRKGEEPVEFPSQELAEVLERTLGVPLFQEQAMKIAIVAAGFTPSEADRLRRAMATFRKLGIIHEFRGKLIDGMTKNGYDRGFAERCFKQIEGFGTYGFPESHAASFAQLVYVSAWMKCHYPAVFACALLNSQPMGFYAPAQIVRDARDHGVEVLEPDVNASDWDCTLEPARAGPGMALRLGLRQIKGLSPAEAERLVARRGNGYPDPLSLWRKGEVGARALEALARADAFRSMGLDRREALWAVKGLPKADPLPLFAAMNEEERGPDPEVRLPKLSESEHVVQDYASLRLSLKAHPLVFLRDELTAEGYGNTAALHQAADGQRLSVAGLVLVRQRPGSAKGVIFITLEDETGIANLVVWPDVFQRFRATVLKASLLGVTGKVQRTGKVIHLVAETLVDQTERLATLEVRPRNLIATLMPAAGSQGSAETGTDPTGVIFQRAITSVDEVKHPIPEQRKPKRLKLQQSRDFH